MSKGKTLIIGASGQIGIELVLKLREQRGVENVVASDIREAQSPDLLEGPFEIVDTLDKQQIYSVINKHGIEEVYQLAALLSATGEKFPEKAWDLNMNGLFHVLEAAKDGLIKRIFWPSSIAVFGPNTPRIDTPQFTIMEPTSVYGISKLAGERWCQYYFNRYGVDVRSIRYPGLIGYKSEPGGGTTDYAVDIFYHAIQSGKYKCFLSEKTMLPMMMMDDAIRATIGIMEAPSENVKIRGSYNLAGMSFTPAELALEIKKHIPNFQISYESDFRQALADSWPNSIDDTEARQDWGWKAEYDTTKLVETMVIEVGKKIAVGT
ncbi:MAG: NAD-dependent epimerase/dehydratase family protein [Flavobacteriales bacterium]|nr:NAD-dependent epimerase/dehydratase family protein [Flavobacteriales bacterium]